MEHYSAICTDAILPFMTTWIHLKGIMLSEVRQKRKKNVYFHSYVAYKAKEDKKQMNKQTKNQLISMD